MTDDLIGKTLGRYRLEAVIGRDSHATVYRASDPFGPEPVAVKVVAPGGGAGSWFGERFVRAMRPYARLQHPAILPVLEVGDRDGLAFLVTPLLTGGALRERLGRPLPLPEALALLRPVAEALDYAHAQRLVHGAVRPANVLFSAAGRPLLADFGITQALREAGMLAGAAPPADEAAYLSPEQAQQAPLDGRADLYSLGAVFHEALTGRPPDAPERPALPADIAAVLQRALAVFPHERHPTGAALCDALAAASQPAGADTPPRDTGMAAPAAMPIPPAGGPVTPPPEQPSAPSLVTPQRTVDDAALTEARGALVDTLARVRDRQLRGMASAVARVRDRRLPAMPPRATAGVPAASGWRAEYRSGPDQALKRFVATGGVRTGAIFIFVLALIVRDLGIFAALLLAVGVGLGLYLMAAPNITVACDERGITITTASRLEEAHSQTLAWREISGLRYFETSRRHKNGRVTIVPHFAADWRGGNLFDLSNEVEGFPELVTTCARMTPHLPYTWVPARLAGDLEVLERRGAFWKVARPRQEQPPAAAPAAARPRGAVPAVD